MNANRTTTNTWLTVAAVLGVMQLAIVTTALLRRRAPRARPPESMVIDEDRFVSEGGHELQE